MLRRSLPLILLAASVVCDFYSARYDDFDIRPLLENDRILVGYIRCFLDKGPCTPDAKDFKKVIPEALQTVCARCSPKQQQLIKTVIRTLMAKHPEAWEEILERYDHDKKYREAFYKFMSVV